MSPGPARGRPRTRRAPLDDARGAARLVVEAVRGVTDVVEAMHLGIGSGPAILGRPLAGPTRLLTAPIYRVIRGTTGAVGAGIGVALDALSTVLVGDDAGGGPGREAVRAALNGVLGDHLAATGNPLAIPMTLRRDGRALGLDRRSLGRAFPRAGGRLLLLVHGSSLPDRSWTRHGHDHGAALARDLGFTSIHVHYNTGLHVSENGRLLAGRIEELARAWPRPVVEIAILSHSMGGLVARSACHHAEGAGLAWRRRLRSLVFLGTPHHGAPLERGGHRLDVILGLTRQTAPLARLGKIRSAGVTDLRHGNVRDEDWKGRDRFAPGRDPRTPLPLPEGVRCFAIAATTARADAPGRRLPGDGLVPVDSALGRHAIPERTLDFPEGHRWILHGAGHLDLLDRAEVLERLRDWLRPRRSAPPRRRRRSRPRPASRTSAAAASRRARRSSGRSRSRSGPRASR